MTRSVIFPIGSGGKALNIAYGVQFPWDRKHEGAPSRTRPYAEVGITGPKGGTERIWCLIDSGADHLQLPRHFAYELDIPLDPTQRRVRTASGQPVILDVAHNIDLEIEGTRTNDLVLFGDSSIALLGRVTFLNAFDMGLNLSGWFRG